MPHKSFFILIFLVFSFNLLAQDINYARKTINTLCSPKYNGRGYVKNGDGKAAAFIYNEFEKLQNMQVQYNPFSFYVNTFPGKMKVKVDGKTLEPGIDYMVDEACPAVKGNFDLLWARHEDFETEKTIENLFLKIVNAQSMVFVVVDTLPATMAQDAKARLEKLKKTLVNTKGFIFLTNKKLMWSVASEQAQYPAITVADNKFPRTAKKIKLNIDAQLIYHTANNVVASIRGSRQPDSLIMLCAHYDHLGRMGRHTYFPGANDNAGGVAMLLDMAKYYSQNPPEYSIVFIAFAAEEAGLIGSYNYVAKPVYPLNKVKFLINMDLVTTGAKGLMAVNGLVFTTEYDALVKINTEKNYLPNIQARGKAANSDHYWFTEKGIHSFFIYLMGDFPAYHDPGDKANIVPLTEYEDTFRLLRDFISWEEEN